jgi:putative transposase
MSEKVFILTDKCEFVPDEELERELEFNILASAYVFNKTLEYSINRENLVKEFGIGSKTKVNRTYTQKIVKTLRKQKPFLEDAESTCIRASTDRLIKAYDGCNAGRTGFPKFKSRKKIQSHPSHSETMNTKPKKVKKDH